MELSDLRSIFNSPKLCVRGIDLSFKDFKAIESFGTVTALECVKFRCGFPPENAFNSMAANNRFCAKSQSF